MIRRILALFAIVVATVAVVGSSRSQTASKKEENVPIEPQEGAPSRRPVAASANAETADAPPEVTRLKYLQKIPFDRRPSAVLKLVATKVDLGIPPGSDKIPPRAKFELIASMIDADASLDRAVFAAALGTAMSLKDPLELDVAAFHRDIVLGEWAAVRAYLQKLPPSEAKAIHRHIMQSLPASAASGAMMGNPQMAQYAERNAFTIDDLVGLTRSAPAPLEKDGVKSLATILQQAIASGVSVENVVVRLKAEISAKEPLPLKPLQIAQMIAGANQAAYAGDFLPTLDRAIADKDDESLDLLAQHFLGKYASDPKPGMLENAWNATQSVLANAKAKREHIDAALKRAVDLAPKVKDRLGQAWLEQSFTKDRERGREILAAIAASVGQGMVMQPFGPDTRFKAMQLQKTAVEALVRTIPAGSTEWRSTLSLLAVGWLKEAEFTNIYGRAGRLGPRIQRDRFGNMFFYDDDDPFYRYQMQQERNLPRPVEVGEMLEVRPSVAWIEQVEEALRPKLSMLVTQLFLKGGEEKDAFPYIEKLAQTHPEKARGLVHEFLRVWIRNHDLNENRRNYNPYMFMYGFMSRAEGIPLTRSKQERNLRELAEWVERLRKLPIGEIDDELLARAFTASHSSAEIFRVELIEQVFGPVGGLKPKAVGQILQQMRENLASLWREPAVQKDKKTNRKQKDIQAEVLRGYELALQTTDAAIAKNPGNWELLLVKAALKHDENNYRQEVAKSSEFSARRIEALQDFRKAAEAYAAKAGELPENEQSSRAFEQWFYASLGACDLGQITEEKLPDARQPSLIRKCIESLPGDAAEKHMTKFVNTFVTKIGAVKAPVKYRYLKGGLEIVGDHKFAYEARKTFDYYKDLVTEIRLETEIDGNDAVGHGQPFGVFVQLRHTREIERESGGFSRYLQNQNNNLMFAYNFGRPTTDYRDRFQTAVQDTLNEHFEVLSVTFQNENVNSRATREYGWRITPYAYLLLKARGPQVDKIPTLKLDLDFLDTAGYVVLPIESSPRPIDARAVGGQSRKVRDLQITQTLDERQANKGKLVLEIKAIGLGLIPDLESLVNLKPAGFDIKQTDDPGVSVAKFDPDSAEPAIVSERTFTVALEAQSGKQPKNFSFAEAKQAGAKMVYQRFQDADLISVTDKIDLEEQYGKASMAWIGWAIAGACVSVIAIVGLVLLLSRKPQKAEPRFVLPADLTPFSVLTLLERIQRENGLASPQQAELAKSIDELQDRYFKSTGTRSMDLKELAQSWISRAK